MNSSYAQQGLVQIPHMTATDVAARPRTGALTQGELAWGMLGTVGAGMGAYHGYKRNHGNVGWTIGWVLFGAIIPIAAIPIMLAQGFGKGGGR